MIFRKSEIKLFCKKVFKKVKNIFVYLINKSQLIKNNSIYNNFREFIFSKNKINDINEYLSYWQNLKTDEILNESNFHLFDILWNQWAFPISVWLRFYSLCSVLVLTIISIDSGNNNSINTINFQLIIVTAITGYISFIIFKSRFLPTLQEVLLDKKRKYFAILIFVTGIALGLEFIPAAIQLIVRPFFQVRLLASFILVTSIFIARDGLIKTKNKKFFSGNLLLFLPFINWQLVVFSLGLGTFDKFINIFYIYLMINVLSPLKTTQLAILNLIFIVTGSIIYSLTIELIASTQILVMFFIYLLALLVRVSIDLWQEILELAQQNEILLYNTLPEIIAKRLISGESVIADDFEEITVIFVDIVGFTMLATSLTPQAVVSILNVLFSELDELCETFGLEKIKSIGDGYMVAAGIPIKKENHAEVAADFALVLRDKIKKMPLEINVRIGIHSGSAVAGVIGSKKLTYDIWGDTVNIASRMESHGIPGQINVSDAIYQKLCHLYNFSERGMINLKNRGEMNTYLLLDKR
ncbi:MAG: adenylate/guanylate cyclase domain-containing protein [Mastigocoleus sp.]